MRVICSFCHKLLRERPGGRATDVSHGMCEPCSEYFERLWQGMHLDEYLDGLPQAIVVLDAEGRVLAANVKATKLLGRDPASPRGLLAGEAMACSHSRLPNGCGKTIHCRECTIRNTVTQVSRTGTPILRVPAWIKTDEGRVSLEISARPRGTLVEVTIEEAKLPSGPPARE